MNNFIYNKMVELKSKQSKEELIHEIMSLQEIELDDRCFANQCEAGTSIMVINELFEAINELKISFSYEKAAKVYELSEKAESQWRYIKNGLMEMNNPSRVSKNLEDFNKRRI